MSEKSYTIVTVCTHFPEQNYYCLNEFAKSLRGEPILVLDAAYTNYSGLMSKPKGLYKAISERLIKSHYILFTDCFDFVFSNSPKDLMNRYFNECGGDITISAEKNCFPDNLKKEFDTLPSTTEYKYLNSGMIVGKTDAIFTCLDTMDLTDATNDHFDEEKQVQVNPNDQFEWMKVFIKQPVNISLDYEQKLCNTLHGLTLEDLDFKETRIKNKNTGEYPASFHANGGAKTSGVLPAILKHLNL